jgi:nitrite reductase (cytochrome c-552)
LYRAVEFPARQRAAGVPEPRLEAALNLQRRAQWRVDFVNAENSTGFHAPQEAARILAEAIDYAAGAVGGHEGAVGAERLKPNVI